METKIGNMDIKDEQLTIIRILNMKILIESPRHCGSLTVTLFIKQVERKKV